MRKKHETIEQIDGAQKTPDPPENEQNNALDTFKCELCGHTVKNQSKLEKHKKKCANSFCKRYFPNGILTESYCN